MNREGKTGETTPVTEQPGSPDASTPPTRPPPPAAAASPRTSAEPPGSPDASTPPTRPPPPAAAASPRTPAEPLGSPDASTQPTRPLPPAAAASPRTPVSSISVTEPTPTGLSLSPTLTPPPSSTTPNVSPLSVLPEVVTPMAPPSPRPAAASPAPTAPPAAGLNRPTRVSATSAIPGNVGKQLTGILDRPSPRAATSRGLLPRHPSHFISGETSLSTSSVGSDTNVIFLRNLPSHVTAEQLRYVFENAGEITRIQVYEGGSAAIAFRTSPFQMQPPRPVTPLPYHRPDTEASSASNKATKSRTVIVTNYACKADDPELLEFFLRFGRIVSIQRLGKSLQIEFHTHEAATKASQQNGAKLFNKPIYIQVAISRKPTSVDAQALPSPSNTLLEIPESGSTVGETVTVPGSPESGLQVGQSVIPPDDTTESESQPRVLPDDTEPRSEGATVPYQLASNSLANTLSEQPSIQKDLPVPQAHRFYWRRILFLAFVLLMFHVMMVLVHYLLEKNKKSAELSGTCSGEGKEKWTCQIAENTVTIEGMSWSLLLVICNGVKLKLGYKFGWGETMTSVTAHTLLHSLIFILFHYIEVQKIGNNPIYSLILAHAVVFTADFVSSLIFWYLFGVDVDLEDAEPSFDPDSMA